MSSEGWSTQATPRACSSLIVPSGRSAKGVSIRLQPHAAPRGGAAQRWRGPRCTTRHVGTGAPLRSGPADAVSRRRIVSSVRGSDEFGSGLPCFSNGSVPFGPALSREPREKAQPEFVLKRGDAIAL